MNQAAPGKHPKGLFVLFFTEMWERFSYYGMRALLVLYVTKALLRDDTYAQDGVYGSYTGLIWLTPIFGGYIADRFWGNRRSIITGGFLMAIGQFIMFFSASMYDNIQLSHTIMWAGLIMLILGMGLFKPNISTMVGQLYPKGDRRLDSAYTIFYMGINLGAFIGPLICGGLGEVRDDSGEVIRSAFKWGFMSAGIAMLVGTLAFIWLKNKYVVDPAGNGIGILPNKAREDSSTGVVSRETTSSSLTQVILWAVIGLVAILLFKFLLGMDWIGLMKVKGEPYMIEYNCRMGDPETEVVIPRLKNDFLEMLVAASKQELDKIKIEEDERFACTVMAVSGGYPGDYEKGYAIHGLEKVNKESILFHAGTLLKEGKVLTNGGRVLCVTSYGNSISEAVERSKEELQNISYTGMSYRRDIGYEFE